MIQPSKHELENVKYQPQVLTQKISIFIRELKLQLLQTSLQLYHLKLQFNCKCINYVITKLMPSIYIKYQQKILIELQSKLRLNYERLSLSKQFHKLNLLYIIVKNIKLAVIFLKSLNWEVQYIFQQQSYIVLIYTLLKQKANPQCYYWLKNKLQKQKQSNNKIVKLRSKSLNILKCTKNIKLIQPKDFKKYEKLRQTQTNQCSKFKQKINLNLFDIISEEKTDQIKLQPQVFSQFINTSKKYINRPISFWNNEILTLKHKLYKKINPINQKPQEQKRKIHFFQEERSTLTLNDEFIQANLNTFEEIIQEVNQKIQQPTQTNIKFRSSNSLFCPSGKIISHKSIQSNNQSEVSQQKKRKNKYVSKFQEFISVKKGNNNRQRLKLQ